MRPLQLKLKGINSYREEQVIDFETLTSQGLFGIFGPTGSGKSTILDAMTLALYSKLPRDTKNFINTNETTASVSFLFSITTDRTRKYLAERSFRYHNNTYTSTVRNTTGRLIVCDGENETVLADKPTEVTAECIRLLGLTSEDFMRTVVLPQGQFSEFLHLKNKERRIMLQRIFHLEKYGIELTSKIGRAKQKQELLLSKLDGVVEPEQKRKIIGEEFIRVFEEEAKKIGTVDFLVQGTIYPDVIESGLGKSSVIKSHHNVGGLPDYVDFKEIVEPLRNLFKDEVRKTGLELGIPENLVFRQPFPGPGLAIRIIGDITDDKLNILKDADSIFREEIANFGLHKSINQYFAVLTNLKSVGVMGDERTYDYTIALRAVETTDFMTGIWSKIPYEVLEKVSSRIVNEVKHVNRVVYDITSKPPATIEWE